MQDENVVSAQQAWLSMRYGLEDIQEAVGGQIQHYIYESGELDARLADIVLMSRDEVEVLDIEDAIISIGDAGKDFTQALWNREAYYAFTMRYRYMVPASDINIDMSTGDNITYYVDGYEGTPGGGGASEDEDRWFEREQSTGWHHASLARACVTLEQVVARTMKGLREAEARGDIAHPQYIEISLCVYWHASGQRPDFRAR